LILNVTGEKAKERNYRKEKKENKRMKKKKLKVKRNIIKKRM
jgi:hypothetical protein